MKDREYEKTADIFDSTYEEMTDDGKTYYAISRLDELNIALMCKSRKGVIIVGSKGSGKTTLMRRFVQQNLKDALGMESVKVINIFEGFLLKCKSNEEIAQKLLKLCQNYVNDSVILFFKANNEKQLMNAIDVFEKYSDQIKEKSDNNFFKLVIEYDVNSKDESDKFKAVDYKSFVKIHVDIPNTLNERMKIYKIMAATLSEIYNVKITKRIFEFTSVVIMGTVCNRTNLNEFYRNLEYVFAYARKEKQKFITKKVVKHVFYDFFEDLKPYNGFLNQVTAYHESGHALFGLILSEFRYLDVVTIIPGAHYVGVTRFSKPEKKSQRTRGRQEIINEMATAIAGREAERLIVFPYNPDIGARGDLSEVQELANKLVYEFGISKSLGENYVVEKPEELSESMKYQIELEKQKLIEEATKKASEEVYKHKAFIEKLANKLIINLFVTGDEARKMWKKHLEELDKQQQKSKLDNNGK